MYQYFVPFLSFFWASQTVVPVCSGSSVLTDACSLEATWEKCLTAATSVPCENAVPLPQSVFWFFELETPNSNLKVSNDIRFPSVLLFQNWSHLLCRHEDMVSLPAWELPLSPGPLGRPHSPSACNDVSLWHLKECLVFFPHMSLIYSDPKDQGGKTSKTKQAHPKIRIGVKVIF